MVDKDVLQDKIAFIEENIDKMQQLADLPAEKFLSSFCYTDSAKYLLQTSIEAMLDIAHHIIARERYRVPESYADAFSVLAEQGIVPQEKVPVLRQMAKFRNRVVHLYHQVDNSQIYQFLHDGIRDIKEYVQAVIMHVL